MAKPCKICGATGWMVLANSWFPDDGYRREQCHICKGTKVSSFRDRKWEKQQALHRARLAEQTVAARAGA